MSRTKRQRVLDQQIGNEVPSPASVETVEPVTEVVEEVVEVSGPVDIEVTESNGDELGVDNVS